MIFRPLGCRGLALVVLGAAGVAPLQGQVPQEAEEPRPGLAVTVDSIVVRGNERVSGTRIIQTSQLRTGEEVTYPALQDAIRRLFATGEFADVRVNVTPEEPAVFFIDVTERPYVTRYRFRGLESLSGAQVRDSVDLMDGEAFAPARVARARTILGDLLSNEGFPRATIDTSLVEGPAGLDVVFDVAEGPRLGLARVDFVGNDAFSDSELRDAMRTGEEGFLWFQSGELKREEFRRDLRERLPDFYAGHGYIDFAVADDSMVVDTATGKGRLVVAVEEGPRYRIDEFTIEGNRRFPTERLQRLYGQLPDEDPAGESSGPPPPFDETAFREAAASAGDLYRNVGYLRAAVRPSVERVPGPPDEETRLVRARWEIEEGEPAYVRRVDIVGNDYTHDRIIRERLQILPGDIYSQERLVQSVQAIQSIGFFEPLPPEEAVDIQEREDGDIDIVLRVEEQRTGNLNFGMSASAVTGLAGFVGYEQPNLFGQAKSGRVRLLFGGRSQDIEVNYSDPAVLGSRQSATIGLQRSRTEYRNLGIGDRRLTGGFLEIGTPFPGLPGTRLFGGYSIFQEEIDLGSFEASEAEAEVLRSGTRSTANLRLVQDRRRGGVFPVAGNRYSLSARFTGGPLGGDGRFGKYEFESDWYAPIAQIGSGEQSVPIQFTANLGFSGGFIFGDNPFYRERFFMGGTQFGTELRGYEENSVTPSGHIPRNTSGVSPLARAGESYFATTAMVGVKLTNSVFASTFVDAGNIWSTPSQFNPTDLLTGAGVGVSLVTPFGPLGLDYAYGFDRRDVLGRPDPGWELHFKFGQLF